MNTKTYKKKIITMLFIFICFTFSIQVYASNDIRKIKTIEFKGLKYLSKYEIIKMIDIRWKKNNIIIDIESLKKALEKLSLIKRYRIKILKKHLLVIIDERNPKFLLAVRDNIRIIPFELDENLRIISLNRVHAFDKPLIIISDAEIIDGEISPELKKFLHLLLEVKYSNLAIFKEISEIDFSNNKKIKLLLKGRRTCITMRAKLENFFKLNYAIGYFDNSMYYPKTLEISDNSVLFK